MSKGGTVSERLKQVRKELDEEQVRWTREQLPGPKAMYRMGENEFMHHCHLQAMAKLVQEKLNLTDDEIELAIAEEFLEETRKMYDMAIEMKREITRQSIVEGIRPKI